MCIHAGGLLAQTSFFWLHDVKNDTAQVSLTTTTAQCQKASKKGIKGFTKSPVSPQKDGMGGVLFFPGDSAFLLILLHKFLEALLIETSQKHC